MYRRNILQKYMSIVLKNLYIQLIKCQDKLTKKKHNKIIYLLSFPETSATILESFYQEFSTNLIICYTANSLNLAKKYENLGCEIFSIDSLYSLLKKAVPLTKGSKIVFCDNYFAFLAGIKFDKETSVIQLWHANGAIKMFGLEAKYTEKTTKLDKQRYLDVYSKFTHYVVSSQKMANIFSRNYNQDIQILPYGYLPTDNYFNQTWYENNKKIVYQRFSKNKKIALYVPTYRELANDIPINFNRLHKEIGDEWTILVKAHPHDTALKERVSKEHHIVTDFGELNLQQLLPFVDCLITDYSSVPFEYTLANSNGKIVFFCYDLTDYDKQVGIEQDFIEWAPGKIVSNEQQLIEAILDTESNSFDVFNQIWNQYSDGNATNQLIEWVNKKYAN